MKKLFFIIISLSACFFVVSVFIYNVGENPIKLKHKKNLVSSFFPQGWSFFTKEPPKYRFNIYEIGENKTLSKVNTYNTDKRNLFGLKKSNRLLPHYIETNLGKIKESHWLESELQIYDVQTDCLNHYSFNEPEIQDFVKGEYIIQLYEINPWVYFANEIIYNKKLYYIKLSIN